jgi:hypothetical protein
MIGVLKGRQISVHGLASADPRKERTTMKPSRLEIPAPQGVGKFGGTATGFALKQGLS